MAPLHLLSVAGSIGLLILSIAVIVDSVRKAWPDVIRAILGAPLASGAFSARYEAADGLVIGVRVDGEAHLGDR